MHSAIPTVILSLLFPLSFAKNIPITVGADAKLAFNPSSVTAAIGDTLTFSYFPQNHSVTQSSFTNPCHPLAGSFNSGFQPLAAGPNSSCQAPPSPNTLDAYKLAAAKTGNSTSAPNISGGRFISLNATSTTGQGSTASGTASSVVASSTGSGAVGSSGGSGSGSSSSGGFGSSASGSPSTSPSPMSFQGASIKFASGLTVMLGAPGIVACALV